MMMKVAGREKREGEIMTQSNGPSVIDWEIDAKDGWREKPATQEHLVF